MRYPITNNEAINNMVSLDKLAKAEHLQAGYPNWYGLNTLKLEAKPGQQPGVTWCVYFAFEAAKMLGFNYRYLTNIKGIGYTNANDMYRELRRNVTEKKVREITVCEAQKAANDGRFVVVSSFNMDRKIDKDGRIKESPGHIAVVRPYNNPLAYNDCCIVQAGAENGVFMMSEIFKYSNLTSVMFVELPKK